MSKKEKLLERFKSLPNDFTFDELVSVFKLFGYIVDNKGTTSGSRVRLQNGTDYYNFHRPHPGNIVKQNTLKAAYQYLKQPKLL